MAARCTLYKWIESPVAEIWPFAYLGAYGTPFGGKGRSYGSAMAPFERAMVVSYRLSIVTVASSVFCNHSAAICDRMSPTLKSTGSESFWAKISRCSHWSRPPMFGSAESEHPRLTSHEFIFEEFQPMWSQSTNVTDGWTDTDKRLDRQTDDMRSQDRALHSSASRGKTSAMRKHAATPWMSLFCCGGKREAWALWTNNFSRG